MKPSGAFTQPGWTIWRSGTSWSPSNPEPSLDDFLRRLGDRLASQQYARVASLPTPVERFSLPWIGKWRPPRRAAHRMFDLDPMAQRQHAAFQRECPAAFTLFELFFLHRPVRGDALEACLGASLVTSLLESGMLLRGGADIQATVRIVPYRDQLFLTDPPDRTIRDFAYLGRDSIGLAEFLDERLRDQRRGRGLDLCTGVGIHAILLAEHCEQVIGVDLNERALGYASRNARLNGRTNAQFVCGDLAAPPAGPYDLVVSNPPFRFLPESLKAVNRDGFGGALGMEKTRMILSSLSGLLAEDGMALLLTVAPVVKGTNLLVEDLRTLSANTPCDAEVLVTDLSYSIEHHALYREHGVEAFLTCYLTIRKSRTPRLRVTERIPRKTLKQAAIRLRQWTAP